MSASPRQFSAPLLYLVSQVTLTMCIVTQHTPQQQDWCQCARSATYWRWCVSLFKSNLFFFQCEEKDRNCRNATDIMQSTIFYWNEIYTVCAFLLESFSKCLEVNSEIDFYNPIVIEGKLAQLFCLFSTPTCFIFRVYKHRNYVPPPGIELRRRSRWGPFSNLPLLPSAPICPSHCNHSSLLSVCLLGALKSTHSDGAQLLALILTSHRIVALLYEIIHLHRGDSFLLNAP